MGTSLGAARGMGGAAGVGSGNVGAQQQQQQAGNPFSRIAKPLRGGGAGEGTGAGAGGMVPTFAGLQGQQLQQAQAQEGGKRSSWFFHQRT